MAICEALNDRVSSSQIDLLDRFYNAIFLDVDAGAADLTDRVIGGVP